MHVYQIDKGTIVDTIAW